MNKIKKIAISVMMVMMMLLGLSTTVKAANDFNVGGQVMVDFRNFIDNRGIIFCIQKHQYLNTDDGQWYTPVAKITFVGDVATDHTGKQIKNPYNAVMRYILSQEEPIDEGYISGLRTNLAKWNYLKTLPVQNAIWNHMATWMNNIGYQFDGLYVGLADNDTGTRSWVDEKAEAEGAKYANQTVTTASITDNTNKDNIRSESYESNGVSYVKMGPFNWSFQGDLKGIEVEDQNGRNIGNVLYSIPNGNSDRWVSSAQIQSGTDFYIAVPMNQGVEAVTKLKGKVESKGTWVTISFWASNVSKYQNLIQREKGENSTEVEIPFDYNIPMLADLNILKVDKDNNEIKLEGVEFVIQQVSTGKFVKEENKKISYVERNQATVFKTDREGKIHIENLIVGTYKAYEISNPNYGYEVKQGEATEIRLTNAGKTTETKIENEQQIGHLTVIKVNQDNTEIRLANVGFILQYTQPGKANTGKYVKINDRTKEVTYVDRKEDAKVFMTDQNGTFTAENLLLGKYQAYEVSNANYGYEFSEDGATVNLSKRKDYQTEVFGNEQKYIRLSGYVWLDEIDGKTSVRNDIFKTADSNSSDVNDVLLNGITVRLMDKRKTGAEAIVKTTKTSNLGRYKDSGNDGNGEYLFEDVLIKELQNYYIEFEYDGLTYTNVIPHINQDRGSKAAESTQERENFNQNFTAVEGESRNSGFTRDANGNRKYDLIYNVNEEKHEATLVNSAINETPKYPITANTDVTQYNIRGHFEYGQEEVRYINLGIYEREQPDMAVVKDLDNVKVTVNGYEHTYKYSQRFLHEEEYDKDGGFFNVGVKFGSKYTMSYRRPIYEADYLYINEQEKSKELKVYVTYEIRMRNKSSNLSTQINSLVDYYDARYDIVDIGTEVNERGNIVEGSRVGYVKDENYNNNGYKKVIINTNQKLDKEAGKDESKIFVQVELNREAVINVLNGKANLENVVEINSYSIYDKAGKIYAGIDKNSNPGNCVPGDKNTYEDDTDSSPDLILEPTDARQIGGKVFLDETTGELKTGEIRQGSGKYEEGEKGIEGVDITLAEITGSGKTYTAKTDANGDFVIEDYIPGDYTLTYTWGDQTYTVQGYKGTVYDSNRDQNNKRWWYQADGEAVVRYSDAIDDYEARQEIDKELMHLTSNTSITKNKMNSTTPVMGLGVELGVEYESVYTASMGDKYVYKIDNIDFGIVERPRQEISLDKRIKTLKATLANGQVIANLTIEEDANGNRVITGDRSNVTYMKPDVNINPKNGFIRLELDNELIQGCIIEVGYEIKATNLSELDYLSENFYKYGIVEGNKVTIEPTAIIDYLDNKWAFDQNKNPQWTVKTVDEIKNLVATTVYNSEQTTIEEKIILYTEALKGQFLAPTESASVMLNVSKVLTTTDEISLDNETEIVEINKTGGSKPLQSTPGNYVPGAGKTETDDDMSETTIVTPATGENRDYIGYIALTISSLGILVAGVIFIKKKILK